MSIFGALMRAGISSNANNVHVFNGTITGKNVGYRETTILAAAIKTLRATPVDLVPAPGTGKFLQLIGAVIKLDAGSEALTESADNLVIQYGGGQDATAAIETTGFIDQTTDQIAVIQPATIPVVAASTVENDELELFNTGDGEFAGNASNNAKLIVGVFYCTHEL